jgi:homospermidine synthase
MSIEEARKKVSHVNVTAIQEAADVVAAAL